MRKLSWSALWNMQEQTITSRHECDALANLPCTNHEMYEDSWAELKADEVAVFIIRVFLFNNWQVHI